MLTIARTLAAAAAWMAAPAPPWENPCGTRAPGSPARAFVVVATPRASDTLLTAAVCLHPPDAPARKVGSYHGELRFDSTQARVLRVEKPSGGGVRVENTNVPGVVKFAGADPTGFDSAQLLRVTLRLRRAGRSPQLRLRIIEMNATDGKSLLKDLVTSAPAARDGR